MEVNTDRPGLDYRSFDLPAADPNLCRNACAGEANCKAFTYVRLGVQGPNARCWLKSSVPNPVSSNCCVSGVKTTPPIVEPPIAEEGTLIFDNGNIAAVDNNPSRPTVFTINVPHRITYVQNYHWNSAKGSAPGKISFRHADGWVFGPWQTAGYPGQGGVPNAYWRVAPKVEIPAGTYTVLDSEPQTWSHNGANQNTGMTRVLGVALQAPPPPPPPVVPPMPITQADLIGKTWQFGRGDGSVIAQKIKLLSNGRIEGYAHPNESRWGIEGNTLIFYHESGKPATRYESFTRESGLWVIRGPFLLGTGTVHVLREVATPQQGGLPSIPEPVIYTNGNIAGVQNNPTRETTFTIDAAHRVTYINTYHYFNGGKLPGTIGLRHSDGTMYGPWQSEGALGQGGVQNAYWFVLPKVEIKAGSYTVVDSDRATWSQNSGSSGAGFVEIRGTKTGTPPPPPPPGGSFVQRCADNPVFVTSLYQSILKRVPDSNGHQYWVNSLQNGMRREDAINGFFESAEYRGFGRNNRDYGRDLYNGVLGREPEAEGHNNWISAMNNGMSRAEVLRRFFASPEYQGIVTRCGTTPPPPPPPPMPLTQADLIGKTWQFGRGDGSVIAQKIKLLSNGRIEGYAHPNESRWGIEGNTLIFYHESGKPATRYESFTRESGLWVIRGPFLLGTGTVHVLKEVPATQQGLPSIGEPVIYTNGNIAGVQNNPTRETTFTIDAAHRVTYINTYHYFNNGKLPGTIALRHGNGTMYGPWQSAGALGQGGVLNAYWFVRPNVEMKPGIYTVIDSDRATWSQNSGSSGAGFVEIRGIKTGTPVPSIRELLTGTDLKGLRNWTIQEWMQLSARRGEVTEDPDGIRFRSETGNTRMGIMQTINADVSGAQKLILKAVVKAVEQRLDGTGWQGREAPVALFVTYTDINGQVRKGLGSMANPPESQADRMFWHGFYYADPTGNSQNWNGAKVNRGSWYTYEMDLMSLNPKPKTIHAVGAEGSGWSVREGKIQSISLKYYGNASGR